MATRTETHEIPITAISHSYLWGDAAWIVTEGSHVVPIPSILMNYVGENPLDPITESHAMPIPTISMIVSAYNVGGGSINPLQIALLQGKL
jgi:hypothetical protein